MQVDEALIRKVAKQSRGQIAPMMSVLGRCCYVLVQKHKY
jgi:hypothetical protein